jgi:hypothetical protein
MASAVPLANSLALSMRSGLSVPEISTHFVAVLPFYFIVTYIYQITKELMCTIENTNLDLKTRRQVSDSIAQ